MALQNCLSFLQKLIQTPSLPGQEREISELVKKEMEELGYDRVFRDDAGNLIGLIKGRGEAPAIMMNTHLDHVDVGDPDSWPHPPFAAEIHEKRIWGRGAVDIKGPLAAQTYGAARLKIDGLTPPGDVYVTAVVQEEIGGAGALHLLSHLKPPLVVVGEPSQNQLRRGHRGRIEAVLHIQGRSVHASIPDQGVNPLQVLARFLLQLEQLQMRENPDLGASSVAPTLVKTDQKSPNVVPAELWLTCDWRNVPGESAEDVCRILQQLADRSLTAGATARVKIAHSQQTSYTGLEQTVEASHPAYILPADDAALKAARKILGEAIDLSGDPGLWRFATDGGHFAEAGLTVVGFGPGDDRLAHTVQESIAVDDIEMAMEGYRALAAEWALEVHRRPGGNIANNP